MKTTHLILPLALVALLSACSSTPLSDNGMGAPVESRGATGIAPVVAGGVDASGLARELTDPASTLSKRSVYFDLDQYVIKTEYQDLVSAHARWLKANQGYKMLIQGNTDERGSREYNLSLGQKRAEAVRKALTTLGVRDDQLESVSLGEEKPKNSGHDDSAWAENRRADMLYRAPSGKGEF